MKKKVHVLVLPGFADWEPAHALAELRRHGGYDVCAVGLTRHTVRSMGGLSVLPDMTLSDVSPADVAVFILPGGESWEREPLHPDVIEVVARLDDEGIPIGAICAATTAIARAGLIRGRRHTSNGLEYLKHFAPSYTDEKHYIDAPAVRDRGLITASGLSDVEFAGELMTELNVLDSSEREQWTRTFRSGRVDG